MNTWEILVVQTTCGWDDFKHKDYRVHPGVHGAYGIKDGVIWFEGTSADDVCRQIDEALSEA